MKDPFALAQTVGEHAGLGVVVGQLRRVVRQGIEPGGRVVSGLSHAAADHPAVPDGTSEFPRVAPRAHERVAAVFGTTVLG